MPTSVTAEDLRTGSLTHVHQVRLSDAQYGLLRRVADQLDRPLGALIRDVCVVYALQHVTAAEDESIDVAAIVADLQAAAEEQ